VNRNSVHATILVDELIRAGVRDLCLAPGSRSTPLVLAAAAQVEKGRLRARVFVDERSASFFALGLGKATGRPAAVLTTSGTAVANLLPAVIEAAWSEAPLLVLTADRPSRLRDADANQVIVQQGIFGNYPVLALELPEPEVSDRALRHLRSVVSRGVAASRGLPAGPVHLNVPYDKPLEPGSNPADLPAGFPASAEPGFSGRPAGVPWVEVGIRRPRADDGEVDGLVGRMAASSRGVVVAGPHPEAARLGPVLRALSAAWGVPLLADPLSGARYGAGTGTAVLGAYDLVLRDDHVAAALRPDLILRIGAAPTSAAVLSWLDRHGDVPQVVVDSGRRWKDHQARASALLQACPVDALGRVVSRLEGSPAASHAWADRWVEADRVARRAALDVEPHEGHIAETITRVLPPGTPLFVSSSMPIRDVDAYGGAREEALSVFGNRGASGIDGIVSSALGVSAGLGRVAVALVGDLAFLHDVNGLLAARESDARVIFVVVDNDGGGIFHMLPVRNHEPAFTPYFATPHGASLAQGAALYGVPHRSVLLGDLPTALAEAMEAGSTIVLSVTSDREANHAGHLASARRAAEAARAATPTL
jgi:2-succinyl-5-enolpyruvyl-6-hydroxy-3-cyclohexene-1-carboxylate synthase